MAIQNWALEHTWTGYREYLDDVLKFDALESEKQAIAENDEAGGGLRWEDTPGPGNNLTTESVHSS